MDSLKEADLNKSETSNEVKIAQTSNEVNIAQTSNEVNNIAQSSNEHEKVCLWERPSMGSSNLNVHFYNVCRIEPSAYTCALDSFLEIC